MPRIARHIEPQGYYHIISRSINENWIFREKADFEYFNHLERKAKKKYPLYLFHYVLMNTHFHFVVQAFDHETLSKHIAYVKWHYTEWACRKYDWKGPLWRERYKSLPIENERYLAACGSYVEYNPVRAGICNDPVDYPFSSYGNYHGEILNDLVDSYDADFSVSEKFSRDYRLQLSKAIFSQSPAIGSPVFIEKHRSMKSGCPQK